MFRVVLSDTDMRQIRLQRITSLWTLLKTTSILLPSSSNPSAFLRPTFITLHWSCARLHRSSTSCTTTGTTGSIAFQEWCSGPRTHGIRTHHFPARIITTSALGHHAVSLLLRRQMTTLRFGISSPLNCFPSSDFRKIPLTRTRAHLPILPMGGPLLVAPKNMRMVVRL